MREYIGVRCADNGPVITYQFCVRAISDEVDTALSPQLISLFEGERIAPVRLLAALAKRPGLAGELWRLARHTRHAGRQLALALGELLTLTLPWAAEV